MKKKLIKTFEEACKAQGLDPEKVLPDVSNMQGNDREAVIAFAKMCIVQRSLNGEWVPDWNDRNQYKYYPWFNVIPNAKGASGFGLSYCAYDYGRTYSYLGVRLFYKDSETAKYAGKTFIDLYEAMILMPK